MTAPARRVRTTVLEIFEMAVENGSWSTTNRREVGPVYQTSIAVIILSVPAHYLPVFQR